MQLFEDSDVLKVREICEAQNARLTKQRLHVLNVLLDAEQAMSAYELAKIYNERFNEKIIATSVYRILEFFIDLRIAYRLDTINKFIACQCIGEDNNNHFPVFVICVQCNQVNELAVPVSVMENMCAAANTPKFKVIDSKVELKGVCKTCECDLRQLGKGEGFE
ncbi:Fur family transcriptional regulator [Glaciecola siphonariae]|uniref:Fur family transcriptional regulator n=1 Tax=Glaciecola siphonariae TaxID=521012 RepID=A0ABV9M190_9ALTE